MAGTNCVLLTLVVFLIGYLEGCLLPVDPIIEVGSDLVLNCTIDDSSNDGRTSQDVIWEHNRDKLPPDRYTSLSDTVSQLTLTNVTFSDWGMYYCHLGRRKRCDASEVSVGRKPEPPILTCVIPSPDAYRCSWEDGTYTQIQTQHNFMFKLGGSWEDCPSPGRNTCNLQLGAGLIQHVRVTSTNRLGNATTEKVFHTYNDVVVNSPSNVAVTKMETETSLRVTWSVPDEWPSTREGSLTYKLRYKKEECVMANHTCCCWLETQDVRSKSFTLRELDLYTFYDVQVAARFDQSREENWSEWTEVETTITRETTPLEVVQGLEINETPNKADPVYKRNVRIFWTKLPEEGQHGRLLGYRVVIQADDTEELRREHNTSRSFFTITGPLDKFRGYLVKVAARNSAGIGPWSSILIEDQTRAPGAPDEVRAVALTTTSIFVEWEEPSQPNGYIENYTVQWGRSNGEIKYYTTSDSSQLSYVINDLVTYVLYEVGIKVVNSRGESEVTSVRGGARTLEGVPDAPPTSVEVKPVKNYPDRLMLSWQRPPAENINGVLRGYGISFCKRSLDNEKTKYCSDNLLQWNLSRPDAVTETLTDLGPSTSYLIWIAAYTAVGVGPDSEPVEGKTTHGILLFAIVIPIAIVLGLCIFGLCVWQYRHIFAEASEDLSKQKSCKSSEKVQKVHDQVVSSPGIAVISGTSVEQDGSEVSKLKTALQSSTGLEPILVAVHLNPKTSMFDRSESGDSGIPSSPENDPLDFSTMEVKGTSIAEEGDDNVFLEDRDGGSSAIQREMSSGHQSS
ncbi:protein sidekick-1-like [Patiria miniata]|uniref:Uncharacterized protein n=1 Tax=Patiria miniata TaxID=46514 RepID=A0A914B2Y4_PATMI|nr:protein sidekick-1-like [Patiria miniata]XP_038070376.1 protein sidekick-1-like [Patiria miniata]XP_038070377.1 protein sidekick-1-like [Patiria miniata]